MLNVCAGTGTGVVSFLKRKEKDHICLTFPSNALKMHYLFEQIKAKYCLSLSNTHCTPTGKEILPHRVLIDRGDAEIIEPEHHWPENTEGDNYNCPRCFHSNACLYFSDKGQSERMTEPWLSL